MAWEDSFSHLLDLLDALGATPGSSGSLLDDTLVMVASEMGRSPLLNIADGKDHWPYTSVLFVGGGLDGGRVIGATDARLTGLPVDLATGAPRDDGERITSARLLAGVLRGMDVDPEEWLPGIAPLEALYG